MSTVLDLEIYTEGEAARLLGVAPSTLHYWLQGGERRGTVYKPVLRPEAADSRYMTWAEFVEAGWLRAYRKNNVPMKELRGFIELLRDGIGVAYPLANRSPFVSGQQLVWRAQEEVGLEPYWRVVDEQLLLTPLAEHFLERVTWEGDLAVGWRPVDDEGSTVVVRPDVRFGRPSVGGVSTRTLFEYAEEDASRDEIADEFEVTAADVRWALAYENAREAA